MQSYGTKCKLLWIVQEDPHNTFVSTWIEGRGDSVQRIPPVLPLKRHPAIHDSGPCAPPETSQAKIVKRMHDVIYLSQDKVMEALERRVSASGETPCPLVVAWKSTVQGSPTCCRRRNGCDFGSKRRMVCLLRVTDLRVTV